MGKPLVSGREGDFFLTGFLPRDEFIDSSKNTESISCGETRIFFASHFFFLLILASEVSVAKKMTFSPPLWSV